MGFEHRMNLRFRALDLNGDGRISITEMNDVFVSMGMPSGHAANVQRIIKTYDQNADGTIGVTIGKS